MISIIVPAFNEGEAIIPGLELLSSHVKSEKEVLVVVDSDDDSTIGPVLRLGGQDPSIRLLLNSIGPGPANAIRFGVENSRYGIVLVMMADGCDDPNQVDKLAGLVARGVVVASASRYMPGGQQVGGPRIKKFLSRSAGLLFSALTGVGTKDPTNAYKAYSKAFMSQVGIDSLHGFEMGIEMTAKARRLGLPVAEIATIWIDRTSGVSNFRLFQWIPKYFAWFLFGLGLPHVDSGVRRRMKERREQ